MYIRELTPKYKKKRIGKGVLPDSLVDSPSLAADFFVKLLGDEPVEKLIALYVDCKLRPISFQYISIGTVDRAVVFPREIAKGALLANASGVIIAHNHPSGGLTFSQEDLVLTNRVESALETVDIALHDHLVIGETGYRSWRTEYK